MPAIARRAALAATAATLFLPHLARAQAWPSRTVRLVVPFVPGGSTDIIARIVAEPLAQALGQPVVVENRAGANGWIANEYVMRERPDGHTLIVNNVSTQAINSAIGSRSRPVTPVNGLMPVCNLVEVPQIVVTPPDFPATTLAAFIAQARLAPAPLVYATGGVGSFQHLDFEGLSKRTGITLTHLPMRGAGEMLPTILRGDAQITELLVAIALPQVQAGRMRAIAVTTPARLPQLPEVQTTAEAGFADVFTTLWNGVFAPLGTPPEVIATLHRHLVAILRAPAMQERLRGQGMVEVASESPAAFGAYVDRDVARFAAILSGLNLDLG